MSAELFEFKRALELKLRLVSEINSEFDASSTEGQGRSFRTQGPMQEEMPPPSRKSVSRPLSKPIAMPGMPRCTFCVLHILCLASLGLSESFVSKKLMPVMGCFGGRLDHQVKIKVLFDFVKKIFLFLCVFLHSFVLFYLRFCKIGGLL